MNQRFSRRFLPQPHRPQEAFARKPRSSDASWICEFLKLCRFLACGVSPSPPTRSKSSCPVSISGRTGAGRWRRASASAILTTCSIRKAASNGGSKSLRRERLTRGKDDVLHNMRKYLAYERADRDASARRSRGTLMRRLAVLGLCGAVLTFAPSAFAQSMGEVIGHIFDGANLRNSPPPAPDFVVNSRPETNSRDYTPFGAPDAAAASRKKTAKDFEAIGAELQRAGAINRQRGAQAKAPGSVSGNAPKTSARTSKTVNKRAN
jgi:hypothetical protein